MAKRELRKRRAAALETGALLSQKAALERKVEELMMRVDLDKRWREEASSKHKAELDDLGEQTQLARARADALESEYQKEKAQREALAATMEQEREARALPEGSVEGQGQGTTNTTGGRATKCNARTAALRDA